MVWKRRAANRAAVPGSYTAAAASPSSETIRKRGVRRAEDRPRSKEAGGPIVAYLVAGLCAMILLWYFSLRNTYGREVASRTAIFSDEISSTRLPPPYDVLQWNVLHVNVIEEAGVDNLEILAYVPSDWSNKAQVFSAILDNAVRSSICRFDNGLVSQITRSDKAPGRPRALIYRCPIPTSLETRDIRSFTFELEMVDADYIFVQNITLKHSTVPVEPLQLGICVSPLYGSPDVLRLLEWRLHHARLGFEAVHWYERGNKELVRGWIALWNDILNTKDTWGPAPSLSDPDFADDTSLSKQGAYADQVPYYMDCLARSKHTHPSRWLAFIDLDEFFLASPSHRSSEAPISDFLQAHSKDTASICIGRTDIRGPSVLPQDSFSSSPPLINNLGSQVPPSRNQKTWNAKCLHRSEAVELIYVHWPETFREGQPNITVSYTREEDGVPRVLHARHDQILQEAYPSAFPIQQDIRDWIRELWLRRDQMQEEIYQAAKRAKALVA